MARSYSAGEELAHAVSHGSGAVASLVALPVLLLAVSTRGLAATLGAAVFGVSVLLLYAVSASYHAATGAQLKRRLQALDHSAIYLLIAGTYTPFTLTALKGTTGTVLLIAVWTLAIVGIGLEASGRRRHALVSSGLYVAMGWIALVAIKPIWTHIPAPGLAWLLAGGVCYTLGVPFYVAKQIRWTHFVWHMFVITGTVCHYIAVAGYAV